ncbi:hypothetical protein GCM10009766_21080 [Microcella frigidaquae]
MRQGGDRPLEGGAVECGDDLLVAGIRVRDHIEVEVVVAHEGLRSSVRAVRVVPMKRVVPVERGAAAVTTAPQESADQDAKSLTSFSFSFLLMSATT